MSFECLVAADGGGGSNDNDGHDSCGHHDFWELEESSTGDGALSKLGSGTGMWPLSSVGNCKGQETFSNCGGFLEEVAFLSCIGTNGGSSQHAVLGAGCWSVLQRLPRATAGGPGNALCCLSLRSSSGLYMLLTAHSTTVLKVLKCIACWSASHTKGVRLETRIPYTWVSDLELWNLLSAFRSMANWPSVLV